MGIRDLFLAELNEKIGELLTVEHYSEEVYIVKLKECKMIKSYILSPSIEMVKLVNEISKKHFNRDATFNNTDTIFWI